MKEIEVFKKALNKSLYQKSDEILNSSSLLENEANCKTASELERENWNSKESRDSVNGLVQRFQKELERLFEKQGLCEDSRYLRRVALAIREINHSANKAGKEGASMIHFLSTPWGAPFVSSCTLLEAADHFSEQEPKFSDLAELLEQLSIYREQMQPIILSL